MTVRGRNWRLKPSIEGTSASQRKRRLGWFTAVAKAARLAGCSHQGLHEACPSYAEFSIRNAARRGCSLGPYDGTLSDQMQMRRWGRAEAKPMSRDLTAPRAEYLARMWGRLVAGYDRARDEAERERAADQARLVAGDYRDADEIATDDAAAPVGRKSYPPHQLGAVASFLKLTARRGGTDFSAETIAAALQGSGYSAALIAELLVELKAAGHYDVILAEAAAAGPLD